MRRVPEDPGTALFGKTRRRVLGLLFPRPDESFYVQCDLDNNPDQTRELGQLIVEIGVAPTLPFEFVVLRVGRVRDSLEVREQR